MNRRRWMRAPLVLSARSAAAAAALTLAVGEGGELPTEFRLFTKGWNETENGKFLFDDEAAAATMSAFETWGVDLMIDLEHQSLEDGIAPDPTAKDARGWCRLELRNDGSLWAVGVSWTDDGAARLRGKRQRYVSPAFAFDTETKRVTSILNVAITAIPATHDTPALVAARAIRPRKLSAGPSDSEVNMALYKALADRYPPPADAAAAACSKGPWVIDVFETSVVFELEGKLFELSYAYDGAAASLGATPAEVKRTYTPIGGGSAGATNANKRQTANAVGRMKMDPKLVKEAVDVLEAGDSAKALEILKGLVVSAAGGDPAGAPADDPAAAAANAAEPPPDDKKKDDAAMMAAARVALEVTGKTDPGEAMAELARRSRVATEIEAREAALSADRATLDATERRSLVAQLVKLGVEIPATAWSDDKGTVPCERLAKEPIDALRARVAKLTAASGGRGAPPVPPAGNVQGLTPREVAMCTAMKIDPAKYAATRKAIRERSNHKGAA